MRGSPAFQITLRNFSVWRVAVATIALGVVVVLAAWAVDTAPQSQPKTLAVLVVIAAVLWLALRLWQVPVGVLAWNGERWQFKAAHSEGSEWVDGSLEVRLDLGHWMLLRFVCEDGACAPRVRWLPAQRDELDSNWHRLRCAIYSPQALARGRVTQDG